MTDTIEESFLAEENPEAVEEASSSETAQDHLKYSNRVLQLRSDSVLAQVQSTIALSEGLKSLTGDEMQLNKFLMELCKAKLLTHEEATSAKQSASVQSKWRKVSRYADTILHDRVRPFLNPGYTVMYDLCLLIGDFEEQDQESPLNKMCEFLSEIDGPLTREAIKKKRTSLKPPKKVSPVDTPSIVGDDEPAEPADEIIEEDSDDDADELSSDEETPLVWPKHSGVVATSANDPISAALLIVSPGDDWAVGRAAENERWQQMADQMAEDSVVLVFTRLDVLLDIRQVIDAFRPINCNHVYLLSEPENHDAATCEVLAVYSVGDGVEVQGAPSWKVDDPPHLIAKQLLLGVEGRRVQFFFSDAPAPDWETLTVDQG